MVVRAYVFETIGGKLLYQVKPSDLTWSETANQPETVTATFDLNSTAEGRRDWRNVGAAWKHSLAIDANGRLEGGPIMPHNYDADKGMLRITARGGRIIFTRRSILPLAAFTQPLTLPNGEVDASLDSTWSNFDLGTIAKKIGEQACAWPGGGMPIIWPADREGTHNRTYPAIERKKVDAAWTDISKVENGPDIRLALEWDGPDRFRWAFQSGTQEKPRLAGDDVFVWELGQGTSISVETNPTLMGSLAWSQGGRSTDKALVRSLYDATLIEHGYPLLELESDASSNTEDASILDSSNVETLRTARKPWEFWEFRVRADGSPHPYEYGPGSLIDVVVTKDTQVRGGYVPAGTHRRRIAAVSGRLDDWVTITCGESYDD